MAIEDENYVSVQDNLAMDPNKTYFNVLVAIKHHNTMFIKPLKRRKTELLHCKPRKRKRESPG